jgi:hypothetical protein
MSSPRVSHFKVVVSGLVAEAMQYAKPVGYNLLSSKKPSPFRKRRALAEQEISESSISRTKNTLIRLINANSRMWNMEPQFITFTFKENVTDLSTANAVFTNFIKRLNYRYFGTKQSIARYVVVPEFQKRGAVHYHAIFFNLPPIDIKEEFKTDEFQHLWGQGFIKIKPMDNIPNVGLYMTKYMTKDATDRRLVGRKKYFSSRHLLKPDVISYEHIAEQMIEFLYATTPKYSYITKAKKDSLYPPENPTFCSIFHLTPEQLSELKNFYTVG